MRSSRSAVRPASKCLMERGRLGRTKAAYESGAARHTARPSAMYKRRMVSDYTERLGDRIRRPPVPGYQHRGSCALAWICVKIWSSALRKDIMHIRVHLVGFAIASVLAAGCNGPVDPANNQTQTFTGSVAPGGQDFQSNDTNNKPFNVGRNGEFSAQFVSLTPPLPGVNLCTGIAVVQMISGQCSATLLDRNNCAVAGKQALPAATNGLISPGSYCVVVFDSQGAFPTTETYTVTVSHP